MIIRKFVPVAVLLLLTACAGQRNGPMMMDGKGCQMMTQGSANGAMKDGDHAMDGKNMPGKDMTGCPMMRKTSAGDHQHASP